MERGKHGILACVYVHVHASLINTMLFHTQVHVHTCVHAHMLTHVCALTNMTWF